MELSTSGFTLPLLHPFVRWARRARRRSPAAAAKQIQLLHPIHQEGVFLVHQKLGRFWSTRKLSTCSHFEGDCTYKNHELDRISQESPSLERGAPWLGRFGNGGNGVIVPSFCQMIQSFSADDPVQHGPAMMALDETDLRAMSHKPHFCC